MDMMKSTMTTAHATPPICSAMVLKSNCIARPPGLWVCTRSDGPRLGEPEVHRDRHDDRNGHAVEQGRCVDPLLDSLDGGRVQQGDAPEDLDIGDLALGTDRALQDDHTLDPG